MNRLIFSLFILVSSMNMGHTQVTETKKWCLSKCDLAGDERQNTEKVFTICQNDSLLQLKKNNNDLLFPIRVGIVSDNLQDVSFEKMRIRKILQNLNDAFASVGFTFYLDTLVSLSSTLSIETLSLNDYLPYFNFSMDNDLENVISLYVFDHDHAFCEVSGNSVSCGRTGGFSFILSNVTNNIVLSQFDLDDPKVVAHEFGHFFGLYHTFEEYQFGKDLMSDTLCASTGDKICDTPADPGSFFEVYVNYSTCEMKGFKNENGEEYKPLIQNYMSYYKPCYLKEYMFTDDQIDVLRVAGHSPLRLRFTKN